MYPKIYPAFLECGGGVQAAEYYMLSDFCHRQTAATFFCQLPREKKSSFKHTLMLPAMCVYIKRSYKYQQQQQHNHLLFLQLAEMNENAKVAAIKGLTARVSCPPEFPVCLAIIPSSLLNRGSLGHMTYTRTTWKYQMTEKPKLEKQLQKLQVNISKLQLFIFNRKRAEINELSEKIPKYAKRVPKVSCWRYQHIILYYSRSIVLQFLFFLTKILWCIFQLLIFLLKKKFNWKLLPLQELYIPNPYVSFSSSSISILFTVRYR